MRTRGWVLGLLTAGAVGAAGVVLASPAWAGEQGTAGCQLSAAAPKVKGGTVSGTGVRRGCSDTVTYLWVRVYEEIPFWPDGERAVRGVNYVKNGEFTATGNCDGRGEYYTHTSTATGASGDSVESARKTLC